MDNEKALCLLKESININTTLGNEKQLADILQKKLEEHQFEVRQVEYSEGRSGLIATLKGSEDGPVLGLSGHLDVVPVGGVPWETDPFNATEKGGKLFGRGSCDMKSGLIALIAGVFRFLEKETPFKGTIKFLITMGEESSSLGAKQMLDMGEAEDIDAMVIAEPTDLKIGIAHKGALWPKITFFGKTAHGSMPDKGINAIQNAMKAIRAIDDSFCFTEVVDEAVGSSTISLNIIEGGKSSNVVPDECTVIYDIRTVVSQDHEEIKKQFVELLDGISESDKNFKYNIEFINDLPAMKSNPDDPFIDIVSSSVSEVNDIEVEFKNPAYYTDGSIFFQSKKEYPIVILGPGEAEMAHQPNEYVDIEKFYNMISIAANITEKFLK